MPDTDSKLLLTDWLREKIDNCRDELNLAEIYNKPKDYALWKKELANYKMLLEIALNHAKNHTT